MMIYDLIGRKFKIELTSSIISTIITIYIIMLKFEQYIVNNYKQEDLNEITNLLKGYTKEQKNKVALLLINLANIYENTIDNNI